MEYTLSEDPIKFYVQMKKVSSENFYYVSVYVAAHTVAISRDEIHKMRSGLELTALLLIS